MGLARYPDWQSRLDRFLRERQFAAFQYGRWDCCLFVCDAIREMTGVDPAAVFRGRYRSRTEARQAIRELTGSRSIRAVVECVTASFGMAEIPVRCAQRGDAVLIERSSDYSLALVALNGREMIAASSRGLWRLPLSQGVRAWRV